MRLIKMVCPNCGASFEVEEGKKTFFCKYCRTTTMLDDGTIKVEHTINDKHAKEKLELFNGVFKMFKGIGIASLVYFGIIMVVIIAVIGIITFNISKVGNNSKDNKNDFNNIYNETEVKIFNSSFELYNGTNSSFFMDSLLDLIVTNNKTKKEHVITVIYGDISTIDTDEIVNIKHSLEDGKEYEVSFDYNDDGYIYKVTINELD